MLKISLRAQVVAALSALALSGCTAIADQEGSTMRYETIPGDAYAVVADIRAKPGMEDKLRAATLPLVAKVRGEPNNILYFLHEDRESLGHFIFYEIFATQSDFEAHNATSHVQAWFAQLPELAVGDVKVMRMEIL